MAKLSLLGGTTSKLLRIFIQNNSVTTGAGLSGLVFNTAGLTAYYIREGAASTTAISLATQTLGTWATGGFIAVDPTNMPGVYELGIPNAAIAAGAKSVIVFLQGATNMAPILLEIELTAVDNQNATSFGLTDLDAAISSRMATYSQPAGFLAATFPGTVASPTNITAGSLTTITGNVNGSVGSVTGAVGSVTGSVGSIAAGGISSSSFVSGAITTAAFAAGAITAAVTDSTFDNAIATSVLTNTMTEAYPTKGAAFTLSQAIYNVHQYLTEFNIVGSTRTILRRNQSTTANTGTLNSPTSPTALTQAT